MSEFPDFLILLEDAEKELSVAKKAVELATDATVRRNGEAWLKMCQQKVDQLRSVVVENSKHSN